MSVSIHIVGPDAAMADHLARDLEEAQRVSIAVAFAKRSALDVLDFKRFCRKKKNELRLVAGVDFTQTDMELIRRIGALPRTDCRLYLKDPRNFHPKLYVLDRPGRRVAYVGSSNLTLGGLRKNVEANVRIEGASDAPELVEALATFEQIYKSVFATPLNEEYAARYDEIQSLRRQAERESPSFEATQQLRVAEQLVLSAYRATVANKRWLLVTTPQNFEVWMRAGIWAQRDMKRVQEYEPGDLFFFQLTGRGIVTMGMFTGDRFESDAPIDAEFPARDFRYRIKFVVLGTLLTEVSAKEVLGPTKKALRWYSGYVRSSHAISSADFKLLRRAFEAALRRRVLIDGATP